MQGYIYAIRRKDTGKIKYIGQSVREEGDWYFGSGVKLSRAYRKYGRDQFEKITLKRNIDLQEDLDIWERVYIKLYDTLSPKGYNLKLGGRGGAHSKETCETISKKLTGKPLSESHRKSISRCQRGKKRGPLSEQTKLKISNVRKGWNPSAQTRENMRKAQTGKTIPIAVRQKISETMTGRKRPKEHCENLSKALTGKKFSASHRASIGKASKGRKQSPETIRKRMESTKRTKQLKKKLKQEEARKLEADSV